MLKVRIIYEILRQEKALNFSAILLIFSLFPLADFLLVFVMGRLFGELLFLSLLMLSSLGGYYLASHYIIQKDITILQKNLENGYYSQEDYDILMGSCCISFLLIMPTLIGTVVALVFLAPPLRLWMGRRISKCLGFEWREIHGHLVVFD